MQLHRVASGCGLASALLLLMEKMTGCLAVHIVMGRPVEQDTLLQVEDLIGLLHCVSQVMGHHEDGHLVLPVQSPDHGVKLLDSRGI